MDTETKQFILETNKNLVAQINNVLKVIKEDINEIKKQTLRNCGKLDNLEKKINETHKVCVSNKNSLDELIKRARGLPKNMD